MKNDRAPEWQISPALVPYDEAILEMEQHVKAMQQDGAFERVWLLEHPPLYTLGTSAKPQDILDHSLPSFKTGRGGEVTYHGPGQRVGYMMLDLSKRVKDVRAYVGALEEWLILTLRDLGVEVFRRQGRVGLWVPESPVRDAKIAAIGVRVSKWVTYHGVALNLAPDLAHYKGIIPCGIRGHGVTSLKQLGIDVSIDQVDEALKRNFGKVF